mmetsp:Transcript_116485/g.232251  ORF Transcript_116485/g.232251 Transcript_116485/m.232251 type:complete len:594 (-) Transcript_116485:79-1860(-)
MAILCLLHTFTLACAFAAANTMTSEDALAAQRLYENAPPELKEVIEQLLLQEPEVDEDAEQVTDAGQASQQSSKEQEKVVDAGQAFQQLLKEQQKVMGNNRMIFQQLLEEQDLDEHEEVDEKEGAEEKEMADEDVALEEVEEKEGAKGQEAMDAEKTFEADLQDLLGWATQDIERRQGAAARLSDTRRNMAASWQEVEEKEEAEEQDLTDEEKTSDEYPELLAEESGVDLFAVPLETDVQFENPWAFVSEMVEIQKHPPKRIEELVSHWIDHVKDDMDVQMKESKEMPVDVKVDTEMPHPGKMNMELPHLGEVGAKNTEPHVGEPLMIRDAAMEASASPSLGQHVLLQMNQFSFSGNVLNRPKNAEDDVVHWIVQFCPNWWEPCIGLTDTFARVGSKLEGQLNSALFMRNIRFATVDCASEKVLCNEQEVETYPTTRHYYRGEFVASWHGGKANHAEFYAEWLIQQAEGITPEKPAGYFVGNLTNSTKGSKEKKKEKRKMTLPTLKEISTDLFLVATLVALCTRAILSNAQLWQGTNPQLQLQQPQQQQQQQQRSDSSHPQELHETQASKFPKHAPHGEHCRQRKIPAKGVEL